MGIDDAKAIGQIIKKIVLLGIGYVLLTKLNISYWWLIVVIFI